ncbi:uncharacterized protein LOC409869 isoform X2 [Apis mellifera]|uniref:Uncharacterized protein LOC409869 isoform X2 n=1 Tax=Apis mellifera TaxID=7460 RepID=A0A7M7MPM7_APIME|nr:uncharacterized protein LOC409869 isoform X2 [Apis mellifera]|eukprot:XP_026299049.1 uncharacterized protein LOC409869 isoform X2 [Apis mellifera]
MTSLQICLVLCCKSWNSVHNAWSKCPDSKPSFSIPPRWTRSNVERGSFFKTMKYTDSMY